MRSLVARPTWRWSGALLLCLLATSCSGTPATPALTPGEWREFEATWSATGTRQSLNMEPGHQTSIFSLSGSLLVSGQRGLVGFRAEVIGLSDSRSGGFGRAVWTDDRGDRVFSELRGSALASGAQVTGTIIGGTGRFTGVTGEYELRWRWVMQNEEGGISGRTENLKGRVKIPASTAAAGG